MEPERTGFAPQSVFGFWHVYHIIRNRGRKSVHLSSPGFEKEMEAYFGELTALTLDFEKLEYISSAGLRTILSVQQYMEDNGYRDVKVINVNTTIRETFEVTGFMDMIDVE